MSDILLCFLGVLGLKYILPCIMNKWYFYPDVYCAFNE